MVRRLYRMVTIFTDPRRLVNLRLTAYILFAFSEAHFSEVAHQGEILILQLVDSRLGFNIN